MSNKEPSENPKFARTDHLVDGNSKVTRGLWSILGQV